MFQLKTPLCICTLFLSVASTGWSAYPILITSENGFKAHAMSSPGLGIHAPNEGFFKRTNYPGVVGGTVEFHDVYVVNDGRQLFLEHEMNTMSDGQTYRVQLFNENGKIAFDWTLYDARPIQPTSYGALERHKQLPVFTLQHSGMSMDSE